MDKKKVFLLLASIILLIWMFPKATYAAEEDAGLGGALESIRQVFGFLPELMTYEKLLAGDPGAMFWAKFLIWLAFFAVTYFGASFAFKQNLRIAVVVALVFSIISAFMIPSSVIPPIFQTYGLLAAVLFWIVPAFVGLWFAHKFESRIARAIVYLLALIVLSVINVNTVIKSAWSVAFPYFLLLWVIVLILFLYNLAAGLGEVGIGGGGDGQGWLNRIRNVSKDAGEELDDTGRWWNKWRKKRRGKKDTPPNNAKDRWWNRWWKKRRKKGDTPPNKVKELNELKQRLNNIENELKKELGKKQVDEIERLKLLAELIKELGEIQKEIKALRAARGIS